MTSFDTDLDRLPIRARAALLLWSARRCARVLLHVGGGVGEFVRDALDAVSRWARGAPVTARELYAFIPRFYDVESALPQGLKPALYMVHNLMAYVTAHADAEARRRDPHSAGPLLPDDIADVTEADVRQGLAYAREVCGSGEDERWRVAVERLAGEYGDGAEGLGPIVPDEFLRDDPDVSPRR